MAETKVSRILRRRDQMAQRKKFWNVHYQALAEIFAARKAFFTESLTPGDFLQEEIFDNTGQFAAFLSASMFLSMLWPDGARTFRLKPVEELRKVPGIEAYFKFATHRLQRIMDHPKAGLKMALMEHFYDQGVFGTSGVGTFDNPNAVESGTVPAVYNTWSVKNMMISENSHGFIDTIISEEKRTVRQVVEEYNTQGKRVHPQVLDLFKQGKFEEIVEVLKIIEPKTPVRGKQGVAGMPVGTTHIDVKRKFTMWESGFTSMPVAVARAFKTLDEQYGRSSGMTALPDANSLNALSEAVLVATEKQLDPPLGLLDSGRLGGAVVDTSAGALTVFKTQGNLNNEKPIFPILTVGEMVTAEKLMVRLEQKIMQAFFLDRLLDLNNKVQMTAFETSIRNRMRGESLSSIFSRQKGEVITPTIERSFDIAYRKGHLGIIPGARIEGPSADWGEITGAPPMVVPAAIVKAAEKGLDVFEIEYTSPAERFMKAEQLQGIFTISDFLGTAREALPGIGDNFDPDAIARLVQELGGAPDEARRTADAVRTLRALARQGNQQVEGLAAAEQASKVALSTAQAAATARGSGGRGGKS